MSIEFDELRSVLQGGAGSLAFPEDDLMIRKLAMLIEGECEGLGADEAAAKFGYSRARYYQLRTTCRDYGVKALADGQRGPQRNYRRSEETVRRIIRYRFLDPDASAEVVAQKLKQDGVRISVRSVERVITDYGLQKKGSTP
jgi:transposase